MARGNEPEIKVKNIKDLFKSDFYRVPRYQREYAWSAEQINLLTEDISEFLDDDDPYYLMGQIVLVGEPGRSDLYEIVDGQQRLTSLFLLLIAIYKKFEAYVSSGLEDEDIKDAHSELRLMLSKKKLKDKPRELRLEPANNSLQFLEMIFRGKKLPEVSDFQSVTTQNLENNYSLLSKFMENEIYSTPQGLYDFYEILTTQIFVTCLTVSDHEKALTVFEKVNDRGMPLNSADLLKNLLFISAEPQEYELLSDCWAAAAESIFRIKSPRASSSMEFLLKAMLAKETGRSVPKKKVYREWKEVFQKSDDLLESFGAEIRSKADSLYNLSQRRTPNGSDARELFGTWFTESSQQFTVLLAGDHLNPKAFAELCRIVDARFMLSSLSGERTQTLEVLLSPWAKAIGDLPAEASVEDVHQCSPWVNVTTPDNDMSSEKMALRRDELVRGLNEMFQSAQRNIGNLNYMRAADRNKIKYVLARVAVTTEQMAQNPTQGLWERILRKRNAKFDGKGFDLEHIMPRVMAYKASLGSDVEWINTIGNLVPMIPVDNYTAGKSSPAEKRSHYYSSQLVLTKSLCPASDLKNFNPRMTEVVEKIQGINPPSLEFWNADAARAREAMYWQFLKDEFLVDMGLVEVTLENSWRIIPRRTPENSSSN